MLACPDQVPRARLFHLCAHGCSWRQGGCAGCAPGSGLCRARLTASLLPCQVYGAALQFYEAFPRARLSERQARALGLLSAVERGRALGGRAVRSRRAIAVLSRWPAFPAFRAFLTFLYRYSVSGPHRLPLEA